MKEKRELRKFGLIMAAAFIVLSGLIALRGSGAWVYTAMAAGAFLLCGLAAPALLRPVEWAWMKLAHVLGFVVTGVLLTIVFFTGVTLTGLVMRLLGKTPLKLDFSGEDESYWIEVEEDGPCSRPEKPY